MRRIMLVVAYDGTNYCGWQIQPNGITIEEKLNQALSDLFGEEITVTGASRTDSGVHSLGNVAIFDTEARMPAEKIAFALNSRLPRDIVVQKSMEVAPDFHPRFCDSRKTYEYKILNTTFPKPNHLRDTYFYYRKLDVSAMEKAAKYLEGEHDFTSFCAVGAQVQSFVRTIYSCKVILEETVENPMVEPLRLIRIRITGSGFLYNMVRIIAGTLLEIGSGKYPPEEILSMLEAKNREAAGPTAPPEGLTMIGIEYEDFFET